MAPPRNSSTATGVSLGPDLAALLARVEGAAGADLELDALIVCALLAPNGAYVERSKINGLWCIYEFGPHDRARLWEPRDFRGQASNWPLTGSLDASLALRARVLPEAGWLCGVTADQYMAELFRTRFVSGVVPRLGYAAAPTPALALLAAMLRALIAQGKAGTARSSQPIREDHP